MTSKKVKKTAKLPKNIEMVWNETRQKKLDALLKEHKTLLEKLSKE
jgi:hypothetical protein